MFNLPWRGFVQLTRLDKPVGIYLLLWPTLWALFIAAEGFPNWHIALVFVLGVVIMRSAGCVINDIADRHIDGNVKRTQNRPLVTAEVTVKQALGLFTVLILVAFGLVLTLNLQTLLMSIPALFLASLYPFMKRFIYLPQFVLGAAFSWSILMASTAVLEMVPMWAWILYVANLLWTIAYDTQYAMVDRDDDVKIGVKSSAILFGQYDRHIIVLLQLCALFAWFYIAKSLAMTWPMYTSLVVVAGLFCYQLTLIYQRDRKDCFTAFLHNHYVGLVVAAGILGHFLLS
jgi:4-hydroxybenzoate polyprenyltransferase